MEAFTSYVARLAAAHLVKPTWLLRPVSISLTAKGARALNGACGTTIRAVDALEGMTRLQGLGALSLLPWQALVSSVNSLAKTQQWCPLCLNDWRSRGVPAHYPLLWCLTTVRWCEEHQRRLASRCPNPRCGSSIELAAPPGHCRHCRTWLGHGVETQSGRDDPDEDTDRWFTQATARMLDRGQRPGGVPSSEHMRRVFTWLFEDVGGGRWDHFRARMGLSPDILFRWRTGKGRPSLDMFLTFCRRLNVEPDDLLDVSTFRRLDVNAVRSAPRRAMRAAPRMRNRHVDVRPVREALEQALETDLAVARPLEQVAKDIGVGSQLIRYHFPELARAISVRWRKSIHAQRRTTPG